MRLLADLLSLQDPEKPHTYLTRAIVSMIIVVTSLIYTGFFGVIGAVGVYLIGIELIDMDQGWMYAPLGLAFIIGLRSGLKGLVDYWRNYGHG